MDTIAIAIAKKNKPTQEQVDSAVNNWLDDHPEATTTVQDGAITRAKLDADLQQKTDEVSELKSAIETSGLYTINGMTFDQGGIRSNDSGAITSSALIRTPTNQVPDENFVRANCDSGYEFSVFAFDPTQSPQYIGVLQNNGTFAKQSNGTEIFYTQEFIPTTAQATNYWYRYVMRNKTDPTANITPTEGTHFHVYKKAIPEITSDLAEIHDDIDDINNSIEFEHGIGIPVWTAGKSINGSGNLSNDSEWSYCDYLPVGGYETLRVVTTYSRSYQWNAWYKADKTALSSPLFYLYNGINNVSIPEDAAYCRLSCKTTDVSTITKLCAVNKINNEVQNKLNMNQGIDNAGKVLYVGANGDVEPVQSSAASFNPCHLKVCSYNVGQFTYGESAGEVVDNTIITKAKAFFTKYCFDILLMQEFRNQLNNTTMTAALFNYIYPGNYLLDNKWTMMCSLATIRSATSAQFSTGRKYSYGIITINGKDIYLYDIHLSLDAATRATEYTELLTILSTKTYFIVCGDFNAASGSEQTEFNQFINAGYKCANGGLLGLMDTYHNYPYGKIDNIITSSNIIISDSYVMDDVYDEMCSDHYPIVADIIIN